MSTIGVGRIGEQCAADFLVRKGYSILHRNYYSHWGEIDIVAEYKDKICFIEVKTRIGDQKGRPHDAITPGKLKRLLRPIQFYLKEFSIQKRKYALEVVSIVLDSDNKIVNLSHFTDVPIPSWFS